MSRSPRDLPFPSAGGVYHVIGDELHAEPPAVHDFPSVSDAPVIEEPVPTIENPAAAVPSVRPSGRASSKQKE